MRASNPLLAVSLLSLSVAPVVAAQTIEACAAPLFLGVSGGSGCALRFGQSFEDVKTGLSGARFRVEGSARAAQIEEQGTARGSLVFGSRGGGDPRLEGAPGGLVLRELRMESILPSLSALNASVNSWERAFGATGKTRKMACDHYVLPNGGIFSGVSVRMENGTAEAVLTAFVDRVWPHVYRYRLRIEVGDSVHASTRSASSNCRLAESDSIALAAIPFTRDSVQVYWFPRALRHNENARRCVAERESLQRWRVCPDTLPHLAPDSLLRHADPPTKPQD